MTDSEIRLSRNLEIRRAADKVTLVGYAAVFGSKSEDLGGFREVIRSGAFARSLAENRDVYALADHDPAKRLGRTKNGSLRLHEDDKGLRVEIDLPGTPLGDQIGEEVRSGLLDAMSFGFNVRDQEWRDENNEALRVLTDVDLHEVSVVSFPAYKETSVKTALRSYDAYLSAKQPTKREIERALRDVGLSRTVAKKAAANAFEYLRDADDEAVIATLTEGAERCRQILGHFKNGYSKRAGSNPDDL
ncbi:MAG: HK97 family phage prohead protease [Alphaproteobacteria bacterium]|nr:MAG: HK97 family phage prohead protease [Alphaproteobacteria bacterium]